MWPKTKQTQASSWPFAELCSEGISMAAPRGTCLETVWPEPCLPATWDHVRSVSYSLSDLQHDKFEKLSM